MANKIKQTTSGACANFKACNLSRSDAHNLRIGRNTNPNIDSSLTHLNISWLAPAISDLRSYEKQIRADYASYPRKKKINGKDVIYFRPLPKKGRTKASPIMELILLLPQDNPKKEDLFNHHQPLPKSILPFQPFQLHNGSFQHCHLLQQ